MSTRRNIGRTAAVVTLAGGAAFGVAGTALAASSGPSEKECADSAPEKTIWQVGPRTVEATFNPTIKGCDGTWYLTITNLADRPQRSIAMSPFGKAGDRLSATVPLDKFGNSCTINVQTDTRYGGTQHVGTAFITARRDIVLTSTEGKCAPSTPTPTPTPSTSKTTTPTGTPSPTPSSSSRTTPGSSSTPAGGQTVFPTGRVPVGDKGGQDAPDFPIVPFAVIGGLAVLAVGGTLLGKRRA